MNEASTRPAALTGANQEQRLWQHEEILWAFGATRQTILGLSQPSPSIKRNLTLANTGGPSTLGPQEIAPVEKPAVVIEARKYGLRGFEPLSEWEGVVERVEKNGFQCRLVPLVQGVADQTKVELTEFSFDDLAAKDDRPLVVRGAILYWTIGRSRSAAGTIANLSLVRLRRLPPLSRAQISLAEQEAAELLASLKGE